MRNKDAFSGYHPVVNFLYFGIVLVFSMIFMHPLSIGISFWGAVAYTLLLKGGRATCSGLLFMLPLFIAAALINPAFSHGGQTILAYLPSGNPLTLESIIYGLAAAAMICTVISWFGCYNAVMTSDKFVYLFGRMIPSMSLLLAMTLRFVPKFKAQVKVVTNAQQCIGESVSDGNVIQRAKNGITILSILVTWALENAIDTADSMKSRGYGLHGRTAFSLYRFDCRDRAALIYLLLCGAYILVGACLGGMRWQYYPMMRGFSLGIYSISIFLCYFALCIMPVVIHIREDLKWRAIQ